ncbi:hypothetical protein [Leucobacter tenebrionis]|uniref:hypothetical protein n=1 Tax=Leucobacter tenebrionis TaxID=2873270 RepID=UPI001CA64152|nr:hypothetical protein [Leucobacter tenebrionis]QZY52477.1 hypothetical protein KVY00_03150 [Leucobacter tenebrionis]
MHTGLKAIGAVLFAGGVALCGAAPALAAPPGGGSYTCTGGSVPSGSYSELTIAGMCDVGSGAEIAVSGNLVVASGAVFDAQSAPSSITVGRNVTASSGSLVGLGCQPAVPGNSGHPCATDPNARSTIAVRGNITLDGAIGVFLNGLDVGGNVTISGGGSDIPWSIKNNTVAKNITVSGITEEWLGVMWNRVSGNVTLQNVTMTGSDDATGSGVNSVFVVRNEIGRNITCSGLTPGVFGYGNTIGKNAVGQCAVLAG